MAAPATTSTPTVLALSIACRNLISLDLLSKSDPVVYVEHRNGPKGNKWEKLGRTEFILNNRNPVFAESMEISYYFEDSQWLRFTVYDVDDEKKFGEKIKSKDKVGKVVVSLAEILRAPDGAFDAPLENKKHPGRSNGDIVVTWRRRGANKKVLAAFHARGVKLDNKDLFSKSDPYLILSRQERDGSWRVVHKTEVIKDCLDPHWKAFNVAANDLVDDDANGELRLDQPVRVECYDWDSMTKHDIIGEAVFTLKELFGLYPSSSTLELKHPRDHHVAGKLVISAQKQVDYSFLDYIQSGTEVSMIVGIDFTGSNGAPHMPTSLHYFDPLRATQKEGEFASFNGYQKAIISIADIVSNYTKEKYFPVYGFGAESRCGKWHGTSHCFACNGYEDRPECAGVDGILKAYADCLQNVSLSGPTNFAPIIQQVINRASRDPAAVAGKKYFILLMLTDGAISDLNSTIDAIVQASTLPISIIIVGIGNDDFDSMEALDSDKKLLRDSRGNSAARDIVQFVPFREYEKEKVTKLAKATLKEVPDQFLRYVKMKQILPNSATAPH
eukprot:TRINITY_DN7784_c0_g1_i1.p1 TRINITY_DN7784_c0_g1~~TRINITY_DN7784_c0_g1_i1.p1  ORF type:complete len:557 (-),score=146.93 TRINITY_DN7784_c0_g1_i1:97-1767(-)